MSLYDAFMASDEEATDDDPGMCTKCKVMPWWDDDEGSWVCECGFFEQCDDCGFYPMWDDDEEAWFCACGYDFA